MMQTFSEQEMVKALRNRDHHAFEVFIMEYRPMVHYVCWRYFADCAEREDMAQNVFLKVYEKIDGFRGNSKLSSWLYRIAVNECLMKIRRESKSYAVAVNHYEKYPIPSREENPLTYVANKKNLEFLMESIDGLNDKEKKTVLLRLVEEKSNQDSALLLGISTSAIKSRFHRAITKLRKSQFHLLKETEGLSAHSS